MLEKTRSWWKDHWLWLLIAAQPVLDAIAYFNQNSVATVSGYIRLALMLVLPVWVLFTAKNKKGFLLGMAAIAVYSLLHIANGFRVGYISPYFDVSYLVKVLQAPVLAICFVYLIRDEKTARQGFRGLLTAAALIGLFLILALLTGTGNVTYGVGLGYSGWVIDSNRTANSIILVTLAVFCAMAAVKSKNKLVTLVIPVLITVCFLTNGTKACYFSLFGIFAAFTAYLCMESLVFREKLRWFTVIVLVFLMIFAVVIYPYTPRYRVNAGIGRDAKMGEIEEACLAKGYDISQMSPEERFENPEVRAVFERFYWKYMGWLPDIFDRFGMERVLKHYNMSTDVAKLIDTRTTKISYSTLIWEDQDLLTHILGFEVSQVGFDGTYDLENDWPALYFYYGYLGLALYVALLLIFLLRVARKLGRDFRGSLTTENVALLLCLFLQLGLAQFSGALMRRPNVSIYLALVLGLIWFQTGREEKA